ncbi:MAG TPA: hypothetical protein VNQ56_09815 [Pseudolabrys sp.]|nr:hypothetical protein [Pseudolabrys sp.]
MPTQSLPTRPTPIEKPLPRANLVRIDAGRDRPGATLPPVPQPDAVLAPVLHAPVLPASALSAAPPSPLMTPARRIALDSLEQEFADKLIVDHA